jgi:CRISPR-associated endoribonuclease Cas6
MILEITMRPRGLTLKLPLNYQKPLQALIYNNLDDAMARFIHDEGFKYESRNFKMFTFSKLLGQYKIDGKQIKFLNSITLYISSANKKMLQSLFNYLMIKDKVVLLDNDLAIDGIKMHKVNLPDKKRIKLKCLSSIVTYSTMFKGDGKKFTHYFRPHEKDFSRLIYENLKKKHIILNGEKSFADDNFSIKMPKFKSQVTKYKNYIIEGSYGDVFIEGERELIETGIMTGFGSKNSMGFGMCVPESILSRR